MKKLIFTILFSVSLSFAFAQSPCIPDSTIKHNGISKLPNGTANIAYNETIQFRFPSDTNIGFPVHVDSVKIYDVTNMPYGFVYQCNKSDRIYKGSENGCVKITGFPVDSLIRTYSFEIHDTVWAKVSGFPTIITQPGTLAPGTVSFKIIHNSAVFYQYPNMAFTVNQNVPNPFSNSTEISFNATVNAPGSLKICNQLGQVIMDKPIIAKSGKNNIRFERGNLPSGIYFYTIRSGNNVVTKRMVIKD